MVYSTDIFLDAVIFYFLFWFYCTIFMAVKNHLYNKIKNSGPLNFCRINVIIFTYKWSHFYAFYLVRQAFWESCSLWVASNERQLVGEPFPSLWRKRHRSWWRAANLWRVSKRVNSTNLLTYLAFSLYLQILGLIHHTELSFLPYT